MKIWKTAICIMYVFMLSSCGVLMKNRITRHHGITAIDGDMDVINYPCTDESAKKLLIFFSGDGGWLDFEDQLSTQFSQQGFQTVGVNSRSYFWSARTPEETAAAVAGLINTYAAKYKTNRIYLCGYSFGADVVPFIYNRLPTNLKNRVVALELLSPFATSDFMVHTSDLLNIASDNRMYKVETEVKQISIPIYCFYGQDETSKAFFNYKKRNFIVQELPGDHHYDPSGYEKIVNMFRPLRFLRRSPF